MAKSTTTFVCQDCGSSYTQWQGQCKACQAWNTLTALSLGSTKFAANTARFHPRGGYDGGVGTEVHTLATIDVTALPRLSSGSGEFDRVLGGGLVPGSAVLIGGHPGAGKSTLLLQTLCHLAAEGTNCLYVTGEESLQQVAMRAQRLGLSDRTLNLLSETSSETIYAKAHTLKPAVMVVDSVQVLHSEAIAAAPGSVSQVRECAALLVRFAKQTGTIVLLVGHVTKDGHLAGPKVLEHMIDCSVMLEGSQDSRFRTLRGHKNRFGAVNELGVFAMAEQGLKAVKNPSAIFLSNHNEPAPGSIVTAVWEGTRPLLVEIQALVDDSVLGNPRRVAVGLEHNRLAMLLAVLHRHGGLQLGDQDIFANVVGGIKVLEPSTDLALLLALMSSFHNRVFPQGSIVFGEVGLSGEIRPVPSGQERLQEAAKHGFCRAIVPQANQPKQSIAGMTVIGVNQLSEALDNGL